MVKNHIAKHIEYTPTYSSDDEDRNELFPNDKRFPVTELEDANEEQSIYNKIQVDSNVERNFVKRLNEVGAPGNVKLYFKFPSKYKVMLPKIIGNYNPDWAILRTALSCSHEPSFSRHNSRRQKGCRPASLRGCQNTVSHEFASVRFPCWNSASAPRSGRGSICRRGYR